jgi:NADP-dependent 3-hydroxy acid dehydrogenase YdfG
VSPSAGGHPRGIAVVTGASSGIGEATARGLAAQGWHVVAAARRADRLAALTDEIGGTAVVLDVTSDESVENLRQVVAGLDGDLSVLVSNAGGAVGLDPVATGDVASWQAMFDVNVLGTLRVTSALLPALRTSPQAIVVVVTSTAASVVYEGGGGYAAAKHAQGALARTLRLELSGTRVRVTEIAPGMVATPEFSLNRFGGDPDAAAKVYTGVDRPLTAGDVADCIVWTATRPAHVDVDLLVVRPVAQAAQHKVHREPLF